MRTLTILILGFVLFLIFVAAAKVIRPGERIAVANAALLFIPVWLAATAYNFWIGVSEAGYTVAEEMPILLLLFGLPAAGALFSWRRFSRG